MKKTPILILAGLSGSGKSAVGDAVLKCDSRFTLLRSATTRKPRTDGTAGEYIYLTDEEFARMEEAGEFAECASYAGKRYGTLKSEIDRAAAEGKIPLLILEFNGVESLVCAEDYDSCAIFIYTDIRTASDRLLSRIGTDPDGKRPLSWVIRAERNVMDALGCARYANCFFGIADNLGSVEECRDSVLDLFRAFCDGECGRGEQVEAKFLSLVKAGMRELRVERKRSEE